MRGKRNETWNVGGNNSRELGKEWELL
jgi:hypothetical protein